MPRKRFGRLRVTSQSSYLLSFEEKILSVDGYETIEHAGKVDGVPERAFPRLKSALAISWLYKSLEATLTTRYIHSMTEQCRNLSEFPGTCSDPNMNDLLSTNHLDVTVYNDLQLVYAPSFDPGLTITAGVTNLFNREPPPCYSCSLNGFNGQTYDVPGVFGYVSATYHVQ